MNTLENSITKYEPAIRLESILSRGLMSILRHTFFILALVAMMAAVVVTLFLDGQFAHILLGTSMILTALWLEQIAIYAYHNSYYFRGLNSIIGIEDETIDGATYDTAKAVINNQTDVTFAFCSSQFGSISLIRSGISPDKVNDFLTSNRKKISSALVMLPEDEIFSLIGLGKYLLIHDTEFKKMIKESGVTEEIYLGSLRWVIGTYHQGKRVERWWSKDNLSKTTGIGRDWSFGTAFTLNQFSRNIRTTAVFSNLSTYNSFAIEKVNQIESALARSQSANVMVIGETGVGKIDLVMEIMRRMRVGESIDSISGKQIVVLDTNRLFALHHDKQSLEVTLIKMLNEATNAGNTIIVIENISNFIQQAAGLGTSIPELIDEYLSLPQIQFIATETPAAYHQNIENLGSFVRRFAEVTVDTPDLFATTRVLQNIALQQEAGSKILFTFGGLHTISTAADRFVVEGVMPDKAIELLLDVASKAKEVENTIITDDFVYEVVSEKTGVPAGPIQDSERDLLLHLEDNLHQQVIGQPDAINAIARTMRRARAGIQSSDKPIGSFLFLGPTGVGKTETAKALASVFFGSREKMQRLDMSEYSGEDALEKLIGREDKTGVLGDTLREHPYCVLLLDEFEKANQSIHDVFLQILDEGNFTDSRGAKINARNCIIIATSNAGSQLILKTVQQRKELATLEQEIINNIIADGIYRPELINRFDSTIIFEPLTIEQQTEVASIMLGELYERMKDKGYGIEIDNELLGVLVKKGYSPEFGARPMQRIIQDVVEEKVAQKIISGEMQKGGTFTFKKGDFSEAELEV